jgi:hypothetical protein
VLMLTIHEIGIIPSLERFVSTNYLLRHAVILCILMVFALSSSIVTYVLVIHFGHPTTFSTSDPRVGFQPDSGGRDTMEIISSCASTLITCVYSSVHFNVPYSSAHRLPVLAKLRSRDFWLELWTKITFWLLGIFSPEMLVLHAFYEYMIARRDVKWMHEHGHAEWSLTLAFFADMRGFVTEDGRVVHSGFALHEHLFRNREPGTFDCAALEYDIADRTKADILFKILTTFQIIRFFVGTIARVTAGLPVAPLETITCAYVICTLIYYGLWLKKPYNVTERIVVRVQPNLRRSHRLEQLEFAEVQEQHRWPRLHAMWEKFVEPPMTETDRLHGSEKTVAIKPM